MIEKINTKSSSSDIITTDINNSVVNISNKVFEILTIKEIISDFLSIYKNNIFIKDNSKWISETKTIELNVELLFILSKNIWVKLNDLINNKDIRHFIKIELWFNDSDKLFVKNNRIYVIEYKKTEPRFKWFNEIQLNNIIWNIDFFKWSKWNFIHYSVMNNLNLSELTDIELKDFLTSDFKKYINDAILKSVNIDVEDNLLADWISSLIYREHFDEINKIISLKLKDTLNDSDYLSLSIELKNKILNYYNISDEILWFVTEKVLNKFKLNFKNIFLYWLMPDANEIDTFHSGIEKKLKKIFINELISIFDKKIWFKLDITLLNVIVNWVYDDKRDTIKYWLSKYLVDLIMVNSSWSSIPHKIHKFFSYYSWNQWFYIYPDLTLSFINKNNLSNWEIFNELTNKLKIIKKTEESLEKTLDIHNKKTIEKSIYKKKINKWEVDLDDLKLKHNIIIKKLEKYRSDINDLKKDFFSWKKIQNIKNEMKDTDILYKESLYKRRVIEKKDSVNTLKYRLNIIDDFWKKLKKLEVLHEEHIKVYHWIISDIALIIFELKKQAN